jgi:hypothetical protein
MIQKNAQINVIMDIINLISNVIMVDVLILYLPMILINVKVIIIIVM